MGLVIVRRARQDSVGNPNARDASGEPVSAAEQQAASSILTALSSLADSILSPSLLNAILHRAIDSVTHLLDFSGLVHALDGLPPAIAQEVQQAVANTPIAPKVVISGDQFNMVDQRGVAWAHQRTGQLIVQITDEQRGIVRNIIGQALSEGITVDDTANRIRQVVGLHDRYIGAVQNMRANQYAGLIKAGWSEKDAASQADALAMKYADRLRASRARTIARTEILSAQNQGRFLAWQEAVNQGFMSPDAVKKWVTAPGLSRYGAPCPHCAPYNGITAKWDQPFSNGVMMPPLHPNCRCTAVALPPQKPTDVGDLGTDKEAWEDDGTKFVGTRCDLCPGNCGRKEPVNVRRVKVGKAVTLTACSGLPIHAPSNAVPVTKVSECDPGDVIYHDYSDAGKAGLLVVGPGAKPGTVKVKSASSKGSSYDVYLEGFVKQGKKVGLLPGPVKIAKAQNWTGDVGAAKPPNAPQAAFPVNKSASVHPGDYLYASTMKGVEPYQVLGPGPNGGVLYYSPGAKKKFEIDIDGKIGQGVTFAVVPGPNKTAHLLNELGQSAKPPGPATIADGDPNPTMWQPAAGKVTALNGYHGQTATIVNKTPSGNWAVELSDGSVVVVKPDDLLGLPTASKVTHAGVVKEVASVSGGKVKFTDGTEGDLTQVKHSVGAVSQPAPTPKPAASPATPDSPTWLPADQVLHTKTAGPAGSNTAAPGGFYTGADGKKYYVKAYGNPEQALQETVANNLYGKLGVGTPKTALSTWTDPVTGQKKVLVVTEIVENEGTLGSKALTAAKAKQVTQGFAADVWLANYDAVGTGKDNIVLLPDGSMARIDAGGSLMFRAQGNLKVSDPSKLHSVDVDAYWIQNPDYKAVLQKAGYKTPADIAADMPAQVAAIRKMVDDAGGVDALVDGMWGDAVKRSGATGLPGLAPDLDGLKTLLKKRLEDLEKKYPPPAQPAAPAPATAAPTVAQGKQIGDKFTPDDVAVGHKYLTPQGAEYTIVEVTPTGFKVKSSSTGKYKTYEGIDATSVKNGMAAGKYKVAAPTTGSAAPQSGTYTVKPGQIPKGKKIGDAMTPDDLAVGMQYDFMGNGSKTTVLSVENGTVKIKNANGVSEFSEQEMHALMQNGSFKIAGYDPTYIEGAVVTFGANGDITVTVTPNNPRPFAPKPGHVVAYSKYPGTTYKITADDGDTVTIQNKSGKEFTVPKADLQPMSKDSIVTYNGNKYLVTDVKPDGSLVLAQGKATVKPSQVQPANNAGSTPIATNAPSAASAGSGPVKANIAHLPEDTEAAAYPGAKRLAVDEYHAWGDKEFAAWRSSLTGTASKAAHSYTGSSYSGWNSTARNGGQLSPGAFNTSAKALVNALENASVPEDLVVWRGIRSLSPSDKAAYASVQPGDFIHDHALMSASLNPQRGFGGSPVSGEVVLVMKLPKGTKAAYLGAASGFGAGESEILVQAGSTMRVDKVYRKGSTVYMEVEVVEQNPMKRPPKDPKVLAKARRLLAKFLTIGA